MSKIVNLFFMFGGYLSVKRNTEIEETFSNYVGDKINEFCFQSNSHWAWLFHNYSKEKDRTYKDNNEVLITDGVSIHGTFKEGYKRLDLNEIAVNRFNYCLTNNISNINLVNLKQDGESLTLNLASNRASCGRIYYRKNKDNTLIFSNDLRALVRFGNNRINYSAYVATIKYYVPPDPLTIIDEIKSVPVSYVLKINTRPYEEQIVPYFGFEYEQESNDLSDTEKVLQSSAEFLSTLDPILLLSGGVDSTLIAQYLSLTNNDKIKAYCLAFENNDPEKQYAQYAANKTGIPLEIYYMGSDDFIPTVNQMVSHYIHPFSDVSSLPTFFLLHNVSKSLIQKKVLIDGSGADVTLSKFNDQPVDHVIKKLYVQPKLIRLCEAKMAQTLGLFSSSPLKMLNQSFVLVSKLGEINAYQATIATLFPYDNLFNKKIVNRQNIGQYIEQLCTSLSLGESSYSYDSRSTTMGLIRGRRAYIKTYQVQNNIETLYPYLWKDMLMVQGRLNCKKLHGINKYPLKKILEKSFSKDFIYRKKSGFTPPMFKWLKEPQNLKFAYDTILNEGVYSIKVIPKNYLERIFYLFSMKKYSARERAILIWTLLFTELWLKNVLRLEGKLNNGGALN